MTVMFRARRGIGVELQALCGEIKGQSGSKWGYQQMV